MKKSASKDSPTQSDLFKLITTQFPQYKDANFDSKSDSEYHIILEKIPELNGMQKEQLLRLMTQVRSRQKNKRSHEDSSAGTERSRSGKTKKIKKEALTMTDT